MKKYIMIISVLFTLGMVGSSFAAVSAGAGGPITGGGFTFTPSPSTMLGVVSSIASFAIQSTTTKTEPGVGREYGYRETVSTMFHRTQTGGGATATTGVAPGGVNELEGSGWTTLNGEATTE